MDVFFAKSRAGVERFLRIQAVVKDARLWINGGVSTEGLDVERMEITKFNVEFDLRDLGQYEAVVGTIEDHYENCHIWIEA
ncbi:hypothetical protein [Paraburkholderia rhizosphaerae]|uniref:Uncharacterized protein n=1 Tax=Paraburkholderia rhizosphaerae TaxID=480658 RepID=A0A4R8LQ40_9BURK|nr:hypothetical protein [Paraburkholderia rhizosphaerae]TDY46573.1 hypothetical protein BX592_113202 [Paraburkholderia rhizosphaerae]